MVRFQRLRRGRLFTVGRGTTLLVAFLIAQVTAVDASVAGAGAATCTGISPINPAPDQTTNKMMAGAERAAFSGSMGGIEGDVDDTYYAPVKTSHMPWYDYGWLMLAKNVDNNNQYGSDWVQMGLAYTSASEQGEVQWYQLNNAGEPLLDLSIPIDNPVWVHYTVTFDPCNACTYDQYNKPAQGWAYTWYYIQGCWCYSSPGTLFKQVPIDWTPDSTQYAFESKNPGDEIGGTRSTSTQDINQLLYYYPAGGSGSWRWMNDDGNYSTGWALFNDYSPVAVETLESGSTVNIRVYDSRCT